MSRQFPQTDSAALVLAFGEKIVLNGNSTIYAIFEQTNIEIYGDTPIIQNYFSTNFTELKINDTFVYDDQKYQITEIVDDLSGVINAFYRTIGD